VYYSLNVQPPKMTDCSEKIIQIAVKLSTIQAILSYRGIDSLRGWPGNHWKKNFEK